MKLTCMRRLICIMTALMALGSVSLLSSCDSAIYDDEGDCTVHYRVTFTYDMNMKFANAFPNEVKSVTLYVYDSAGGLVTSKTESGARLASPDYCMDVEVLPGTYDLLVWATGESPMTDHTAFAVKAASAETPMSAMGAVLPLQGAPGAVTPETGLFVDRDITPLFHGIMRGVDFPDTYGNVTIGPVRLMKDTNVVQILLQNTDGTSLSEDDFSFYVTAGNSELNYLNEVVSAEAFGYRPWALTMTSASFDEPDTGTQQSVAPRAAQTEANGVLAELTMGRLMADRTPRLVVRRNTDGEDIIRINLIQYLLMVKGEYNRNLTNQQYLDRQDVYTMMFFVDKDRNWYVAGGIYINGWRVVPPQDTEL